MDVTVSKSEPLLNHLKPLELSCDWTPLTTQEHLNPEVPEFRPTRDAAMAARVGMQDVADKEQANWTLNTDSVESLRIISFSVIVFTYKNV